MKEIWKNVKGYEGRYQVSNLGNVRSLLTNKMMTPQVGPYGYLRVPLRRDGRKKDIPVHILVYEAFYGERFPELDMVVDHKNNNKLDNRASNLQLLKDADNLQKDKKKKSGLPRGVYKASRGGYTANINDGKNVIYLGCFASVKEAEIAVENARKDKKAGVEIRTYRKRFSVEDGFRICTCCGERKPLTDFYFAGGRYTGKCKECTKEYNRLRRAMMK